MEVLKDYSIQEDHEEITKWLNLPYYIAELEYERETFSSNYYQEHSFYSHIVYDEYRGIISEAPRVDIVAMNIADSCMILDKRIKRLKEQHRLFTQWLARSPTNGKDVLKTLKIIQEIRIITETSNRDKRKKLLEEFKNRMENVK